MDPRSYLFGGPLFLGPSLPPAGVGRYCSVRMSAPAINGLHVADGDLHLLVGDDVWIADDAVIGGNVVIHSRTRIGGRCTIGDSAVIGRQPTFGPQSSAPREHSGETVVGERAAVLAGAIILAGARIGEGAIVADQAHLRERAVLGAGSVLGRASSVDNDVVIGQRVRIQTNCYITAGSTLEDDVFIGPGVVTTNDNDMGRSRLNHATSIGAIFRRGCRVGGGVIVCPGVEVGPDAFIAAGAVVTQDIPAGGRCMGVPARLVDLPNTRQ
jgi:acetyltransferase-like isoleucine patch superfamily enzyme